jgi:hypothetical protein
MNKGTFTQLFQSPSTYRIPKLVTLLTASCVFLGMVSLDASASTTSDGVVGTVVSYHVAAPVTPSTNPFAALLLKSRISSNANPLAIKTTSQKSTNANPLAIKTTSGTSTNANPLAIKTTPVNSTNANPISAALNNGRGRKSKKTPPSSPTTTTTLDPSPTTTTTSDPSPTTTTTSDPSPTTTTTGDPSPTTTTTLDPSPTTTTTTGTVPQTAYPIGTVDSSEPSGYGPPSATALAGYSQGSVTDFTGSSLPAGWESYGGTPAGDPGGQFATNHAVVGGGYLSLNTFQDPAYNNDWVTGGVCDCSVAPTYGAFFVRSRVTGAGPTQVELLWPQSGDWPPEIDFNETLGSATATTATIHWSSANSQFHSSLNDIDMTQWHTWGVIWTPSSITYTVDGQVWASVSSNQAQIPDVPMHLALQQQTWCGASPVWACPTAPESMEINWVAEYTPNS